LFFDGRLRLNRSESLIPELLVFELKKKERKRKESFALVSADMQGKKNAVGCSELLPCLLVGGDSGIGQVCNFNSGSPS